MFHDDTAQHHQEQVTSSVNNWYLIMISLRSTVAQEMDLSYFLNFKPVATQLSKADLRELVQRGEKFLELRANSGTFTHGHLRYRL